MQTREMIKRMEHFGLTCKYSEPSGTYTFYADFKTQKPKVVVRIYDNYSATDVLNDKLFRKYVDFAIINEWINTPKDQRGSAKEYEVASNMSPLEYATTLVNRELAGIDLPYAYKVTINIVDTNDDSITKPTHPIATEAKHMPIYLGGKDLNERFLYIMDQYVEVDGNMKAVVSIMLREKLTKVVEVIKAMYDDKRAYIEVKGDD